MHRRPQKCNSTNGNRSYTFDWVHPDSSRFSNALRSALRSDHQVVAASIGCPKALSEGASRSFSGGAATNLNHATHSFNVPVIRLTIPGARRLPEGPIQLPCSLRRAFAPCPERRDGCHRSGTCDGPEPSLGCLAHHDAAVVVLEDLAGADRVDGRHVMVRVCVLGLDPCRAVVVGASASGC